MGRKEVIEFTCDRCGNEFRIVRGIGTALTEALAGGEMRPTGWSTVTIGGVRQFLCDHCTKALNLFMDGAMLGSWPPDEQGDGADDPEDFDPEEVDS